MHHLNQPCFFPMLSPPIRTVEAPPIPLPVRSEVSRDLSSQFLEYAWHNNPYHTARTNKLRDVPKIEIIRAKVMIGIEAKQDIKEIVSKRERMRLGMNRKHLALQIGGTDTLPVVGCFNPEVRCPDLKLKFPCQKN